MNPASYCRSNSCGCPTPGGFHVSQNSFFDHHHYAQRLFDPPAIRSNSNSYLEATYSQALIEEKTGQPVLGLCYPLDSVNPAAFDLLASLRYQFAIGGYTQADHSAKANADPPFALPRYYPYSGDYYPIIGGTHGQTFDEMLLEAIDQ